MFVTIRLTLKRMVVITAAIIFALLIADLVRVAAYPQSERYVTHSARAEYLKERGFEIDQNPVSTTSLVIDEQGQSGWSDYAESLKSKGFDITDYFGQRVTVVSYRLKGKTDQGVRVLLCDNRIVAYEQVSLY